MEARLFVGISAILCAFAAVFSLVKIASLTIRRKRTAIAVQGDDSMSSGLIVWRLRNGVGPLRPVARKTLKVDRVRGVAEEAVEMFADKGVIVTCESIASVAIAVLLGLFALVGLLARSLVAALAVDVCVSAVAIVMMGSERDKKRESIREEVPNALESMAACFSSGFTLLQTFEQVSREVPGRLGGVFKKGAHVLETGGSADKALEVLRAGTDTPELAFVAVALDVQHQSGGTLRQVLEAATDSVKGELALRRSLRVQTAQAKLSARVVIVMPFILIAAFSLASPDFLSPFFSSIAGYALLGLAALMQLSGILLVRRALSVEGVS